MGVGGPSPAWPGSEEELLCSRGKGALVILRSAHQIDGVLDRSALGAESRLALIPDPNDEGNSEGVGKARGEGFDLLLLFPNGYQKRVPFLVLIFAAQAFDGLFLLINLPLGR